MTRRPWVWPLILWLVTQPAHAGVVPGESWVDGQNFLLLKMLGAHLQEISHLTTIINNTRQSVAAANDMVSLARVVKRNYDMLVNYRVEDLLREAKRGLYAGFPELEALDEEVRLGLANAEALGQGGSAFFARWDYHDQAAGEAVQRGFERGYQASLWPIVFPEALKFHRNPSPAEALVQSHYLHTGDAQRRAVQQTAMAVLARKIRSYSEDAESKDNVELRTAAVRTQIEFQTMQNTTDLLNLREGEVAEQEAHRLEETAARQVLVDELGATADDLVLRRGRR